MERHPFAEFEITGRQHDDLALLFATLFDIRNLRLENGAAAAGLRDWAQSGLMLLTGRAAEAPLIPRADYFARLSPLLQLVEQLSARLGRAVRLDPGLFAQRAALLGLRRGGQVSSKGSCRLFATATDWLAINLARAEDVDLIPALICGPVGADIGEVLGAALRKDGAGAWAERGRMLGMAVAVAGEGRAAQPLITRTRGRPSPPRLGRPPLVIDLSALWAGPLCSRILSDAGARVIKVECRRRPDAFRSGGRDLFHQLHAGKDSVLLDFRSREDLARLGRLMMQADVVIEASRPRALMQLGLGPDDIFPRNPGLTWVSITAHGRQAPNAGWAGFGDDAAIAGGLYEHDASGAPLFVGDAIADPVAGLFAAAGALASLSSGGGRLIEVSLRGAAAYVARAPALRLPQPALVRGSDAGWVLRIGHEDCPLRMPLVRSVTHRAAEPGADTQRVLTEFA